MPKALKRKPSTKKPSRKKKAKKTEKRKITRDQFHKLVRKSAQPTKKPKK